MPRTASLGMYDAPGLRSANDAMWSAIAISLRHAGVADVPDKLDRERALEAIWDAPDLLLAQACGYPLATRWRDRLRYVGTLRYRAPGCDGAFHRSRIIVRRDDSVETLAGLRGRRAAVNDFASNTGMNLLRSLVAPLADDGRFFDSVIVTGSHAASAQMVAAGLADVAAIDCVTFAHFEQAEPEVCRRLRTLAWSAASPGLPLVTSTATSDSDLRMLRRAIRAAILDRANATGCAALLITGLEILRHGRYDALLRLERGSARAGYANLR